MEEMRVYLGLRVYMSVVNLPERSMYWSTDWLFGQYFVPNVMTRDRFDKISQYLHCNDSSLNPPTGQPGHDLLHHIRPVHDIILHQCLSNYNPNRDQSVDEAMVKFRGRLSFKQYLPLKPIKHGIKVWSRADPNNGYLHEFQVYTGKQGTSEAGLTFRVVDDLTKKIQGKHHIVTVDNYFMSPALAAHLLKMKTYCRGTIDRKRKGFPGNMLDPKSLKQKGEFKIVQNRDLTATIWKDKKVVNFFSSYDQSNSVQHVMRRNKEGERVPVPCPPVVYAYNETMNGVDRSDQIRSLYSTYRKSKRWWLYLFWYLFDVCLSNAFIMMKESVNHQMLSRNGRPVTRTVIDFKKNLAKQLIGDFRVQRKRHLPQSTDPHGTAHFIRAGTKGRCRHCSKRNIRKEPRWICSSCNVNLCIECFEPYHVPAPET